MTVLDFAIQRPLAGFTLNMEHVQPCKGITVVFGPNGSGKSTLLRCLCGLDADATGRILYGGNCWLNSENKTFVPAHLRGVGVVFQDGRLFPHLTVEGNLNYACKRARQIDAPPIGYKDVVQSFDLTDLLKRRVRRLSGGEKQRVAIARTLLTRPSLLLMDEPLSALDVKRKAELLPYIAEIPKAFGVPILYVTHSIDEVTAIGDDMLVIQSGKIAAFGSVTDVLSRLDLGPATGRFEAGVLVNVTVTKHDVISDLTHLSLGGQELVVPKIDVPVGGVTRLRIRARDVAIATRFPEGISIRNILKGKIAALREEPETAFAETLIDVGGIQIRSRITRAASKQLELHEGKEIFALIKSVNIGRR